MILFYRVITFKWQWWKYTVYLLVSYMVLLLFSIKTRFEFVRFSKGKSTSISLTPSRVERIRNQPELFASQAPKCRLINHNVRRDKHCPFSKISDLLHKYSHAHTYICVYTCIYLLFRYSYMAYVRTYECIYGSHTCGHVSSASATEPVSPIHMQNLPWLLLFLSSARKLKAAFTTGDGEGSLFLLRCEITHKTCAER